MSSWKKRNRCRKYKGKHFSFNKIIEEFIQFAKYADRRQEVGWIVNLNNQPEILEFIKENFHHE